MGLLDDAIREHLELKRRHGASEEEVAQEEAEALGPARRDFPLPAAAEEGQSAEAEGEVEDAPPEAIEPPSAETAIDEPEPRPPTPDTRHPEPEPEPEQAFEPEPRPPTPDTRHPEPDEPEQRDDDDVLEETPEFLQDAPEHDRLWFEQKPPRDFDFE
jgi:hypothetical protein